MLEYASMDTFSAYVLEWILWSNVGVAAAFVGAVLVLGVCCGIDCFRDRRAARLHGKA